MFNINKFLHSDSLSPAMEWKGYPKYNFIGGHNDNESIPIISLKESINNISKPNNNELKINNNNFTIIV